MATDPPVRLEDLVRAVEASTPDDALLRIAAAADLKVDVDETTDALLGHFVDRARAAGCSWSQIGEALGVSKQAAQQRHTGRDRERPAADERRPRWRGRLFTRLTERTLAVDEAGEAARDLGHDYVGTEHLLLGMLRVPACVAALALVELGVERDAVEQVIVGLTGRGTSGERPDKPAFTPRAKKALELALREALRMGHNYVGTEHLLLALLRLDEGLAATVLTEQFSVTSEAARATIAEVLTRPRPG